MRDSAAFQHSASGRHSEKRKKAEHGGLALRCSPPKGETRQASPDSYGRDSLEEVIRAIPPRVDVKRQLCRIETDPKREKGGDG